MPNRLELLMPYAGDLETVPVTEKVGNVVYVAPECVEALVEYSLTQKSLANFHVQEN